MIVPVKPPKPKIRYHRRGRYWVLDTGHADLLFDTWAEALAHAERICDDCENRLFDWISDGNY